MKKPALLNFQQGFSLIEVMVAGAIISFSLLGYMQTELIVLRSSEYAYLLNLADLKNNELAEHFNLCGSQAYCLRQALNLWKNEIKEIFPKGVGQIENLNLNFQSKVQWFSLYSKSFSSLKLLFFHETNRTRK